MRWWSGALIFQTRKAVSLEGLQNMPDVFAREVQEASDTLLMPALIKRRTTV
jgi:hypothetical protein